MFQSFPLWVVTQQNLSAKGNNKLVNSFIKKIGKESVLYALGPIFQTLANFVLLPLYTYIFTPAQYGDLEFVIALGVFLLPIIGGGLSTSFWKYHADNATISPKQVLFNCSLGQITIGSFLIVLSFFLRFLFPGNYLYELFFYYSWVLLLKTELNNVFLYYQARHEVKLFLIYNIISLFLTLVSVLILTLILNFGILGVIWGNFIGNLLPILFFYFSPQIKKIPVYLDTSLIINLFKYGFPLALGNISYLLITTSDRFLINFYASGVDLGLYAYGAKFASLLNVFIISPFFMGFNPFRWEIYNRPDAKAIFVQLYKILSSALVIMYLTFNVFANILGRLVAQNPEYIPGLVVTPLLSFSYLLYGLYYFRAMGLLFEKKTKFVALIISLASMVSVALNILLIPAMGFLGAGISSIVAYSIMFVFSSILSHIFYPIEINISQDILNLLFPISVVFISLTLGKNQFNHLIFIYALILILSVYLIYFIVVFKKEIYTLYIKINTKKR